MGPPVLVGLVNPAVVAGSLVPAAPALVAGLAATLIGMVASRGTPSGE